MAIARSARVHPTAVVSEEADVGDEVAIGPHAVVEGPVVIGPGCVIKAGAHLIGPMTLGAGNIIHSYAVLGEAPQHLRYAGEDTRVEIGERNIFREYVTVNRGTPEVGVTRIGNANFLMANAHIGHDSVVGNGCILANGSLVAGHCKLGDGCFMSGNSAVHQHVKIGRLALLSGVSGATMDVPPFIIQQRINCVVGVNVIGMRRSGIATSHIDAVRKAFHLIYRTDLVISVALAQVENQLGEVAEVQELIAFIRGARRGIATEMDRKAA